MTKIVYWNELELVEAICLHYTIYFKGHSDYLCSKKFPVLLFIGRGLAHKCTKASLRKNLVHIISKDSNAADRVPLSVIAANEKSQNGTVRLG